MDGEGRGIYFFGEQDEGVYLVDAFGADLRAFFGGGFYDYKERVV